MQRVLTKEDILFLLANNDKNKQELVLVAEPIGGTKRRKSRRKSKRKPKRKTSKRKSKRLTRQYRTIKGQRRMVRKTTTGRKYVLLNKKRVFLK